MNRTDLKTFDNNWYHPGAGIFKQLLWYFINVLLINSSLFPFNKAKIFIIRTFGAKIGKGCVFKPKVNLKYPWRLEIGDYCWIGENVWIDNLADVKIGSNVCISQGAMLLCGNHNYKKSSFDLMVGKIILADGVWIGAKTVVCPGVSADSHAVLTVGSVATKDLKAYTIYQGNPAKLIKERTLNQ